MSNKVKIILAVLGIIVLTGGVFFGVQLAKKNQELRSRAAPATSLSISPSTQGKSPGQTFTQTVTMDTGSNQVTGVQFDMGFNKDAIEITSIQKGSGISGLDQELVKTFDNTTGKISYAAFTLNSANRVNGQNISALTINAKVKSTAANGSYQTSFAATTAVSATSEGVNVLTDITPGTVTVSGSAASATPTATATATSGATATATSTSTSSSTSTASSSKTPTPTAPPIPETGTSWPTYLGIGFGAVVIIASLVLAL